MTCALVLLALWLPVAHGVTHTFGIARDTSSGEIRYLEHHQYLDETTHVIRYYDPALNLLATKELAYTERAGQPAMRSEDLTRNRSVTITPSADRINQEVTNSEVTEQIDQRNGDDVVIDAGFDEWIRANWDNLDTLNEREQLTFAIAGQSLMPRMTITRLPSADDRRAYRVAPRNWLLRQIVPPIELEYSLDRRLKTYRGFSNIAPGKGESRTVAISFRHAELPGTLTSPPLAWLQDDGPLPTSGFGDD